jgi:hypothetical protein
MTPADLKAALDAIPISGNEAAPLLGVSRRTLTRLLQGDEPFPPLRAAGLKAQLAEIKKSRRRRK